MMFYFLNKEVLFAERSCGILRGGGSQGRHQVGRTLLLFLPLDGSVIQFFPTLSKENKNVLSR
jgi:hypothetical protein